VPEPCVERLPRSWDADEPERLHAAFRFGRAVRAQGVVGGAYCCQEVWLKAHGRAVVPLGRMVKVPVSGFQAAVSSV
jgi:hypothetical protein